MSGEVGATFSDFLRREELMDHVKYPRNKRELTDASFRKRESNPLCGDEITIYVTVNAMERSEDPRVSTLTFTGHGCMISQAATSLLSEKVHEQTVSTIFAMDRGSMEQLLGGALSPSRVKCAMLALIALKKGLQEYLHLPES